ncbi:hypothetical protein R3P38DRAFT_3359863 [Favolaschia claudopus]|uniref:Uncharacterized protein n=1 Tax=Favolaschia claudopus TaxID=2862362 RepID=A0AAW0B1V6_9AGAR
MPSLPSSSPSVPFALVVAVMVFGTLSFVGGGVYLLGICLRKLWKTRCALADDDEEAKVERIYPSKKVEVKFVAERKGTVVEAPLEKICADQPQGLAPEKKFISQSRAFLEHLECTAPPGTPQPTIRRTKRFIPVFDMRTISEEEEDVSTNNLSAALAPSVSEELAECKSTVRRAAPELCAILEEEEEEEEEEEDVCSEEEKVDDDDLPTAVIPEKGVKSDEIYTTCAPLAPKLDAIMEEDEEEEDVPSRSVLAPVNTHHIVIERSTSDFADRMFDSRKPSSAFKPSFTASYTYGRSRAGKTMLRGAEKENATPGEWVRPSRRLSGLH